MKTVGNCNHSFIFHFSVLLLVFFALPAYSEDGVFTTRSIGIAHIQFQEDLRLEKTITRGTDFANYRGTVLQFQKQSSVKAIGISMGALAGTGRAVAAGSDENLSYSGGAKWFLAGITPKGYYRLTRQVSFGVQGLAFFKSIQWAEYNGISAASKHNFNFAVLGDISMQILPEIELVQSVGSINGDATLWKVGLNYLY